MAREWQPSPAHGPMPDRTDSGYGDLSTQPLPSGRNWSATRGAVLWEGMADLTGSFPGYAHWGSRAQGVHLTLTDHFLLASELTDYGFGLPIGWLSAAQALTGAEPISLESGDRLRVCYVDGSRVRGFTVRVRGSRFGSRAARRANQLRAAALTLGLASTTPSTDLLLPPEHDLALDWDAFATHEAEPVVWTGQAAMPIGSGLELAPSDVWLTESSLIWGARSRAGIYRIATGEVAGITQAESPAREPVIFWSVSGSHDTLVDLPMILARHDSAARDVAPVDALLAVLEGQGHTIAVPAGTPRPWSAVAEPARTSARLVTLGPVEENGSEHLAAGARPAPGMATSTRPDSSTPAQPASARRRLLDDGLFPERVPTPLPASTPRPWGERVERVPRDQAGDRAGEGAEQRPDGRLPASTEGPVADRLRLWPPAVPRRQVPGTPDAPAMLVRRPPVRATTTEEFLASEQAARAAAQRALEAPTPGSTPPSTSIARSVDDRGIIMRFRHPDIAVSELKDAVRQATDSPSARSTSSFAVPAAENVQAAAVAEPGFDVVTAKPATDSVSSSGIDPAPVLTAEFGCDTGPLGGTLPKEAAGGSVSVAAADEQADSTAATASEPTADGPTGTDDPAPPSVATTEVHDGAPSPLAPSHLAAMRTALNLIDEQLATVLRAIGVPEAAGRGAIGPTAPRLHDALHALDRAVAAGEIGACAADTHRQAIARTADTTERLRSLLDLHARGYLTAGDLEDRRLALLGRPAAAR